MPIFRSIENSNSSQLGLWQITEDEEELFDFIHQRSFDMDQLRVFHNSLKKKQWLASRCLITQMNEDIGRIYYDDQGAPYCDNGMKISLSHSETMVAVLLSTDQEIGIDLQHFTPKIEKIKQKFCDSTELEFVQNDPSLKLLHIIWCAKEALYKKLKIPGLIFKENLHIINFEPESKGKISAEIKLPGNKYVETLKYEILGDYTMVFTPNN